ncbi:MAG: outer membrane beta-barrel protein, partial [Lewinella sp.]|nr:outer membrane beta-barrel protein [Lewinella sp.]
NDREEYTDRYFVSSDELYTESAVNESTNVNHRFNGRIEYELNENNSFRWRPSLSWQQNDGSSDLFGRNMLLDSLLSSTSNQFGAQLNALDFSNNLLWRHRFSVERRTLSVNVRTGFAPQNGDNSLLATNTYEGSVTETETLDQIAGLDRNSWNGSVDISYTEPVGEYGMLMFSSETSYQEEDSDLSTYDFNPGTTDYDLINAPLSNVFASDYLEQGLEVGYNYRQRSLFFMLRLTGQYSELINDQTYPVAANVERSFKNLLPMAMLRFGTSRTNSVFVRYRASTDLPSLTQLQEVINNTNPLQLSVGNPGLNQALEHSMMARYNKTNTEKGTIVFAFLRATVTQGYIANSSYLPGSEAPIRTQYNVSQAAQLSRPVNLDGYWNLRGLVTYGFPLFQRALNLNVDLSYGYTNTPSLINDVQNEARNTTGGLGLTLSSSFSDRFEFTIGSRSNLNEVTNTLPTSGNSRFFSQDSRVGFNWIGPAGITLRSDLTHQYYDGLGEGFDPAFWLWNASLGKKLFKDQRGEIAVVVFDLLKENQSLSRNVTEIYFEDSRTNALQQYFMLRFTYDVRNFGTPPQREERPDFGPPGGRHW